MIGIFVYHIGVPLEDIQVRKSESAKQVACYIPEALLEYNEMLDGWTGCAPYLCDSSSALGQCSCSTIFDDLLSSTTKLLEEKNYTFFLDRGTLLGIMRNSSLWPNSVDMDMDIVLDLHQFRIFQKSFKIRHKLFSLGYLMFTDHKINGNIRVCVNSMHPCSNASSDTKKGRYFDNYRFLDIWRMEGLNNLSANMTAEVKINGAKARNFTLGDIIPLKSFEYKGHKLPIPKNPHKRLDSLYPDWEQKVIMSKHGGR